MCDTEQQSIVPLINSHHAKLFENDPINVRNFLIAIMNT